MHTKWNPIAVNDKLHFNEDRGFSILWENILLDLGTLNFS